MEENKKPVHFIGVAGVGMSGMAKILARQGYAVSGSDLRSGAVTDDLSAAGVKVTRGHAAENIAPDVDTVVVSTAVPADNPELLAAQERGIAIVGRGEFLGRMVNPLKTVAVAGSHGKTTTTALTYHVLEACGFAPGLMVGGQLQGSGLNAREAQGEYFVTEADESDGSFLYLRPWVSIVTNIEDDHLDHYGSLEQLQEAFRQYLSQTRGFAILCDEDIALRAISAALNVRKLWYGSTPGLDYSFAAPQAKGSGIAFEFLRQGELLGKTFLQIPGVHNALNAVAAMAVALELGAQPAAVLAAVQSFPGTARRFQLVGRRRDITVIDDYAHHPSEIRATLAAARQVHPGRLMVLFQPHRYSRTKLLAPAFGAAFTEADFLVLTDIYPAGETPEPGVTGELIYHAAQKAGVSSVYIPDKTAAAAYILEHLTPGDLLLTMGAGDIWREGQSILDKLG